MTIPLSADQKDNRKEACKTYIEQTKLLVTLASAFVLAPVAIIGYVRNDKPIRVLSLNEIKGLMAAEALYIMSILLGYVVLGALAGAQQDGTFDVFRPAIRVASLLQIALYLIGLLVLAWLLTRWSS